MREGGISQASDPSRKENMTHDSDREVIIRLQKQIAQLERELEELCRNRLLKLPEVLNRTGLTRSALYQRICKGEFPKPVKIGTRAVVWIEDEVQGCV
jgi:prophage regulatory protein